VRHVLVWKREGSPADAGPAWLDTYSDDQLVESHRIAGGDWIARADAERLAVDHGYEFIADDGAGETRDTTNSESDLTAINARLRAMGISEAELAVERIGDSYGIGGSRADDEVIDRTSLPFEIHHFHLARDREELAELLNALAPGWQV